MATLLLEVGLQVGARLINNLLDPQPKPDFSNLIDQAAYGSPLVRMWGPANRVPGSVIEMGKPVKRTNKLKKFLGGLLGGSSDSGEKYVVDIAYFLADTQIRPCKSLEMIFANGVRSFNAAQGSAPSVGAQGQLTWVQDTKTYLGGWCDSITFYPGNFTQLPDPTLESLNGGSGNVSAYRGSAYVVIKALDITRYGLSLPNLSFLVNQQDTISLATVLGDICTGSGIDFTTVSVSALYGQNVTGYWIGQPCTGAQAIQPLAMAYDFDAAEVYGGLRFTPRGIAPQATVVLEWFDGHEGGAIAKQGAQPYSFTRDSTVTLPDGVQITYPDPARLYQTNTSGDQRSRGFSQNALQTTIPVVMTETEAIKAADRALWEPIVAAQGFKAVSDDRLIWLEPAKTFAIQGPNAVDTYRPKRISRGANRLLDLEAVCERTLVYNSPSSGHPAPSPPNDLHLTGPANAPVILEAPPELTNGVPSLWIIASPENANADWTGVGVYMSTDDSNFYLVGKISAPGSVQGVLTATLASYGGANPDTVHTLSVDTSMSGNDPTGGSAADAARYTPLAYVGGELLSFESVTMTAPHAFDIGTALYRGLYRTSPASHAAGASFAVVDANTLTVQLPPNYAGTTLYFRLVEDGGDITLATTYSFTPTSGAPAAPASVAVTFSGAAGTVTWTPSAGPLVGGYDVQLSTDGGVTFADAGTAGPSATTFSFTAEPGVTYVAQVRALSSGATIPPSSFTASPHTSSGAAGLQLAGVSWSFQDISTKPPSTVLIGFASPYAWELDAAPASPATSWAAGYVDGAPASDTSFTLLKDGVSIGTVKWAAGSHEPTLIVASSTAFAFDDYLDLKTPANLNGMSGVFRLTVVGHK